MRPTERRERDRQDVVDYVSRRTGVSFAGSRGGQLREAVMRAVTEPGRAPVPAAGEELAPETFGRVCDRVTVQESFFFRERAKLEWLARTVLPGLRGRATVRVWSAGCASGEEAYTLAALLREAGLDRYEVLGTDLSPEAVAAARRGDYGRWALRGLEERRIGRLFHTQGGRYRVRDELRASVRFRQHNLLDPAPVPPGQLDLVLCRNVLIYLTPEATARAVGRMVTALAPGGWLLLGASDPLLDEGRHGVEPVATGHGLAYRRPATRAALRPGGPPVGESAGPAPAPRRAVHRRGPGAAPGDARPGPARPAPASPDTGGGAHLLEAARDALLTARSRESEQLAREALGAPSPRPAAHGVLVQALVQDRRLREAVDAATAAVGAYPLDAELRYLQAVVLLEAGDPAAAVVAAQRATYLHPGLPEAHLVLARAREALGEDDASRRARVTGQRLLAHRQGGA